MELRRILMGLYLLAFPAMMWGQTPVVPGTAGKEIGRASCRERV